MAALIDDPFDKGVRRRLNTVNAPIIKKNQEAAIPNDQTGIVEFEKIAGQAHAITQYIAQAKANPANLQMKKRIEASAAMLKSFSLGKGYPDDWWILVPLDLLNAWRNGQRKGKLEESLNVLMEDSLKGLTESLQKHTLTYPRKLSESGYESVLDN